MRVLLTRIMRNLSRERVPAPPARVLEALSLASIPMETSPIYSAPL